MSTWQAAWILSSLMTGVVFLFAKKAGLMLRDSILLGAVWFPAPLYYAIGGQNSVVYLFDFVVPYSVYLGIKRWKLAPANIRTASLLIFFSLGFMPIFTAGGYATDRITFLLAFINLYRLVGALSLMIYFSVPKMNSHVKQDVVLTGFALACIVIILAMVLQGNGYLNSNVLETIRIATSNYTPYENNIDQTFIVLGMFRGSLGILGLLGLTLSIAKITSSKIHYMTHLLAGAAGIAVIILSGSKTSLISFLCILLWSFLDIKTSLKNKLIAIACLLILFQSISFISTHKDTKKYVPSTMYEIIVSQGSSRNTLDDRFSRYENSLNLLEKQPEILVGFPSPVTYRSLESFEINLSYFHNEYLSVLMLGGFWSMTSYIAALGYLIKSLFMTKSRYTSFQKLAGLLFIGCIIQGFTVAHLQPSILFPVTVAILCCIYGLGSVPVANHDFT